MNLNISKLIKGGSLCAALALTSCSLEEVNPGGMTIENFATDPKTFEAIINQCYFGLERAFYNTEDFMRFTEGNTDLWTSQANKLGVNDKVFKFYANAMPDITYMNAFWNAAYDGIGGCNIAIRLAPTCPFNTDEERNTVVAAAHYLRAVYYYHLVELFGGVVALDENVLDVIYSPERTEPIDIYRQFIIPDLRFAVKWLPKGDDTFDNNPTKKAALGMLAKACLATQQYGTTEFLQEGYDAAKDLISDCENGGAKYGCYMYPAYEDIFAESNNKTNKEALWKYSINPKGASLGNHKLNMNDNHFMCQLNHFGARIFGTEASVKAWDGGAAGDFMPTQHLLSLYVQEDGTLDPRFHKSFITEWNANQAYAWTEGDCANYDKAVTLKGTPLAEGDLAIRIVMPQDANYATEVANKANSPYILVEYKDVYKDGDKSIIMTKGAGENHYRYFYPSLNKHCSSNYFDANLKKLRFGNMNLLFAMRMSEVYLIAAEYDILLNGGGAAMGYINKVRNRAGAKQLGGTATIRTVLDERGRELCGEFTRFYDLKRTGMLKNADYLRATHPELAQYFKPEYALHPIPQAYTDVISNGANFQNPGF
ncbi:MAG: RagB/SusD family nutrient uptake outer membrane protein [Duncaniella sp.]|nr:RagB/SusD family nutrient uptake outer membrane protein [Duncaniella sp.]